MSTDTETEILDLANLMMHLATSRMQKSLREARMGLAAMEARTLRFIARHPGCTQSDIVRASGRDKAQIARITKVLLTRDLVQRLANEPGKKRQRLTLTKTGNRSHIKIEKLRSSVAHELMMAFNVAERNQLLELLRRMPLIEPEAPD